MGMKYYPVIRGRIIIPSYVNNIRIPFFKTTGFFGMVHIYGSYMLHMSFFSVQHLLNKKTSSSQTGPPGRGSFVFHELRHPPPKAMGEFSPWPKILGFLGNAKHICGGQRRVGSELLLGARENGG